MIRIIIEKLKNQEIQINTLEGMNSILEALYLSAESEVTAQAAIIIANEKAIKQLDQDKQGLEMTNMILQNMLDTAEARLAEQGKILSKNNHILPGYEGVTMEDLKRIAQGCFLHLNPKTLGHVVTVLGNRRGYPEKAYSLGLDQDNNLWLARPTADIERGVHPRDCAWEINTQLPEHRFDSYLTCEFTGEVHPELVNVVTVPNISLEDLEEHLNRINGFSKPLGAKFRGAVVKVAYDKETLGIILGVDEDNDFWFVFEEDGTVMRDFGSLEGQPTGTDEDEILISLTGAVHQEFR